MNKEFFEECLSFFVPFTNLNQIFLREKEKIEEHVHKGARRNKEEVYKKLLEEINEGFEEECKGKSVPIELAAYCKAWFDLLIEEIVERQQEIVTYQSCFVQAEVAFLKGQVISMINPNGKLADFPKSADINKD